MKFRGLILLLAATGCALAAEQEVLTIEEAVRLAAERYPDVARAKAAAEGLKGRIREVRAQALPDVSINVNGMRMRDPSFLNASGLDKFPEELRKVMVPSPVNLFDYNISVRQPLYTAGKVGTALRIASIESEGAQVDVDRARQDLSVEVVRACYGLLWAERYKLLVEEIQKQRKMHADMARQRFQNGVATEVDVLRSEVALANVTPDLVRAEKQHTPGASSAEFLSGPPAGFPYPHCRGLPAAALGAVGSGEAFTGSPAQPAGAAAVANRRTQRSSPAPASPGRKQDAGRPQRRLRAGLALPGKTDRSSLRPLVGGGQLHPAGI